VWSVSIVVGLPRGAEEILIIEAEYLYTLIMKSCRFNALIAFFTALYFLLALCLNVQGACFAVVPDGAGSAVCGFEYYAVLRWYLMPSFLLIYPLLWMGLSAYLPGDFYVMLPFIFMNTCLIYVTLTAICQRKRKEYQ